MEKSNENTRSKNHGKRMKNVFDRLIGKLDAAEERLTELEGISIETSKTETRRGKRTEKIERSTLMTIGH